MYKAIMAKVNKNKIFMQMWNSELCAFQLKLVMFKNFPDYSRSFLIGKTYPKKDLWDWKVRSFFPKNACSLVLPLYLWGSKLSRLILVQRYSTLPLIFVKELSPDCPMTGVWKLRLHFHSVPKAYSIVPFPLLP